MPGYGTTNSPKQYSYTDSLDLYNNLNLLDYKLKQIDLDGTFTYSKIVTVDLSNITDAEEEFPTEFSLSQNYPNPFNPTTTIKFTIPSVETTRRVVSTKLVVYDILGREVKTLLNKSIQPGEYEVEFDGSSLPSGVYLYRITSGKFSQVRKMVLLK